ncbi:MAG: MBL fold metallo-hydrolase, partial [Candidatus Binatia bacterium]
VVSSTAEDRVLGRSTALVGERGGKYPHGSSLLVRGGEETAIIDPSLSLYGRADRPSADRVILSHCHEDHIAGLALYPEARVDVHEADVVGLRSIDDMMAIYGYDEPIGSSFREAVLRDFHYAPRPDAVAYADGAVFDLGGGVRVRVIHTPGHTRGHSCLFIEPDGVLYLGDIELSSFGPYYGDAWSDLEDFERSLTLVRSLDARWYATFHHIGVLEGRDAYLERLDRFTAMIADRERRLLEFLAEPRTIDEIVAHRFVYRPQDPVSFADPVERRSMSQHVDRLVAAGRVKREGDRVVRA